MCVGSLRTQSIFRNIHLDFFSLELKILWKVFLWCQNVLAVSEESSGRPGDSGISLLVTQGTG